MTTQHLQSAGTRAEGVLKDDNNTLLQRIDEYEELHQEIECHPP